MLLERRDVLALVKTRRDSGRRHQKQLHSEAAALLTHANHRPTDVHAYSRALLAAYQLRHQKELQARTSLSPTAQRRSLLAHFSLEPIAIKGRQGEAAKTKRSGQVVEISEFSLLAPLRFRDALATLFLDDVQITQIEFGCLRVGYELPAEGNVDVLEQLDFTQLASDYGLRSLYFNGNQILAKQDGKSSNIYRTL